MDSIGTQAIAERRRDTGYRREVALRPIGNVGLAAARQVGRVRGEGEGEPEPLNVVDGKLVLTPAQERSVFARHQIMSPSSFSTEYMTDDQKARFEYAVQCAVARKKGQSLIYFARKEGGETGLGSGKSTIARMGLYYDGGEVTYQWVPDLGVDAVSIKPHGRFLTSETALRLSQANEVADAIHGQRVIVVDDVGRSLTIKHVSWDEQSNERQRLWHSLVDTCANMRVAIIFTTNMGLVEFQQEIGDSCVSRLRRMDVVAIDMTGIPDYRTFQYTEPVGKYAVKF